ncbi:MAG: glutamate-5-semialdehyde dehydrogenase [Gemmataceae bacterium]
MSGSDVRTPKDLADYCRTLAERARKASYRLAQARGDTKDRWLHLCARYLSERQDEILAANRLDLDKAQQLGLSPALRDRLLLTPARIQALVASLEAVRHLPDPVGRVLASEVRPNGLRICKVAVPLGVIFFIYESRPNVTVDAAALSLKSGNAIILRGGSEALASNRVLHTLMQQALHDTGLPTDAVQLVDRTEREAVGYLLRLPEYIDLVIPRGGEDLIRRVVAEARMPVLKHYKGNCHVYVHADADLDMALEILVNAKCQRPGVCNAAESLLVHQAIAPFFLPRAAAALRAQSVEIRGCARTRQLVPDAREATEEDYAAEYLDLIISVKIVDSLDEAIAHINTYGSRHTDAIVTQSLQAAQEFTSRVDSAAVMVNASTRFHDGFEFGLGAEIGISTDKFHARGPCGLAELTTYKYIVLGHGHVRL